jgi:hypothetical protein
MRPASCGLATMESDNGILCRTGRIVEADINLRGGPGRIGCTRGVVDSDPEAISGYVTSKAPNVARIGLETGPTSTWLWTELKRLGLPMICIDARHPKAVLKMQINKSDRNDAIGIARIMQTGLVQGGACQGSRQPLSQGATGQPGSAGQDQARSREHSRPSQKPWPGNRPVRMNSVSAVS